MCCSQEGASEGDGWAALTWGPGPGCCAVAQCRPRAAADARKTTTNSTAVATLILLCNMVFNTPSERAAALAEIRPAVVCPAATRLAALIVESSSPCDRAAEARESETRTAA